MIVEVYASDRVLTTFHCGKLDDPDTVEPTLKGLASLVALSTFSDSGAIETIQASIFLFYVRTNGASKGSHRLAK
jgi:hypothetical protein